MVEIRPTENFLQMMKIDEASLNKFVTDSLNPYIHEIYQDLISKNENLEQNILGPVVFKRFLELPACIEDRIFDLLKETKGEDDSEVVPPESFG
jgi:hypothetical protein